MIVFDILIIQIVYVKDAHSTIKKNFWEHSTKKTESKNGQFLIYC